MRTKYADRRRIPKMAMKLKMQIELTAFEAFKAVEFPCKEIEVIFAKFAQTRS